MNIFDKSEFKMKVIQNQLKEVWVTRFVQFIKLFFSQETCDKKLFSRKSSLETFTSVSWLRKVVKNSLIKALLKREWQ